MTPRTGTDYDDFHLAYPAFVSLVENVQRGRFFVDPARSYFSEHAVHHLHGLVFAQMQELW